MDSEVLISRVKGILLEPATEWQKISGETTSVRDIYFNYVFWLAAIPALAGFVSNTIIGTSVPFAGTLRVGFFAGLSTMVLGYLLSLVMIYVLAFIVSALANTFAGQANPVRALQLVAYAYTASFVASVAQIVPWLGGFITLAGGIYSIYLLYLGVPVMMQCPREKAVPYTAVSLLVAFVLSMIIGFFTTGLFGGAALSGVADSGGSFDKDSPMGQLEAWSDRLADAGETMDEANRSGDQGAQQKALQAMIATAMGGDATIEALPAADLLAFLPETLGDLERESYEAERNGAIGMQLSQITARYRGDDGESLRFELVDSGSASGWMAFAGWMGVDQERESSDGFERTRNEDGRMIREQWDTRSNEGERSIVIADRFVVTVRGPAEDFDTLVEYTELVDLEGLEALRDAGKKTE